jgi:hypothetical protein
MNSLRIAPLSLALALFCAPFNIVFAQTSQPAFSPASAWIMTVIGGPRTFTLQLSGVAKEDASGKRVLSGLFGFTGAPPVDIGVEVTDTGQSRTLSFVTPIGGKVVAVQTQDGSFTGTITLPNGQPRNVSFQRIEEPSPNGDDVIKVVTAAELQAQLLENVPPSCGGFMGGWTGNWPGFGSTWLWVVEVRPNCVARYNHRTVAGLPKNFYTTQIKDGVLSFKDSQGNLDSFELRGSELWARHEEFGRNNSAVFRKVDNNSK